jgi:hypothetical protein
MGTTARLVLSIGAPTSGLIYRVKIYHRVPRFVSAWNPAWIALRCVSNSLFGVDANAAVAALRCAYAACLQGHKRVVGDGINRDAMRVRVGGNILQPDVLDSVDHTQDRSIGHVARCQVVSAIAGVVPDFVNAADVFDSGQDRTRRSINDVLVGRKCLAIMVRATYQEVVAWTLNNAGRHAIRRHETINDYWTIGVSESRIDFVYAPDAGDANRIGIRQQQVASIGIPRHPSQTGRRYSPTTSAARGSLIAESPQRRVDNGPMMARDRVSRAARSHAHARDARVDGTGDTTERLRIGRVWAGETAANRIYRNARTQSHTSRRRTARAVIVNLPDDATGRIEGCARSRSHG